MATRKTGCLDGCTIGFIGMQDDAGLVTTQEKSKFVLSCMDKFSFCPDCGRNLSRIHKSIASAIQKKCPRGGKA
jgi:hypothetical protein